VGLFLVGRLIDTKSFWYKRELCEFEGKKAGQSSWCKERKKYCRDYYLRGSKGQNMNLVDNIKVFVFSQSDVKL
jgi:hypothetical protein